jgi:hypothetical protein
MICAICTETPVDPARNNGCTHEFCFTCIEIWSRNTNTCPLCKSKFTRLDRIIKAKVQTAPRTRSGVDHNNTVFVTDKPLTATWDPDEIERLGLIDDDEYDVEDDEDDRDAGEEDSVQERRDQERRDSERRDRPPPDDDFLLSGSVSEESCVSESSSSESESDSSTSEDSVSVVTSPIVTRNRARGAITEAPLRRSPIVTRKRARAAITEAPLRRSLRTRK